MDEAKNAIQEKHEIEGHLGAPDTTGIVEVVGGLWKQAYEKNGVENGAIYYTKKLGAFAVYGAIYKKYLDLGAEKSILGFPVTDETGTPDGVGRFNHFEQGSIYWTPASGAHEIHGEIRTKWASLGWEKGFLGYPVTDEFTTPDRIGRFTHFQGGSIYWTPTLRANAVKKEICAEWERRGWEKGKLGYPISDTATTPDGVFGNNFQGGSIHWSPATGYSVNQTRIKRFSSLPVRTPTEKPPSSTPPTPQDVSAFVSLAIANKLLKVLRLEDDEKRFLSFPLLHNHHFTYKSLHFMKAPSDSDLSLQDALWYQGEFARLMNLIPQDSLIYSPDTSRLLWDEVDNILAKVVVAKSTLNEAETSQLDEAIAFLSETHIDPEDGAEVSVEDLYNYYEIAYNNAVKEYCNEQISVETASDDEEGVLLKRQWEEYLEKELAAAKNKTWNDWISKGYKLAVESHRAIRNHLGSRRNPDAIVDHYRLALDDDKKQHDLRNFFFHDTVFSPRDAFDETTPWNKLTLAKDEIVTLVQTASAELQSIFKPTKAVSNTIEQISLEYNEVSVKRPSWFDGGFYPGFVESRYWRWRDSDDRLVSDTIPSFIDKILAVRNIQITRKKAVQEQPVFLSIVGATPLNQLRKIIQSPQFVQAPKPAAVAKGLPRAAIMTNRQNQNIVSTYRGKANKTPPMVVPSKRREPLKPLSNDLVTESYDFDGVAVLAYICEKLPNSPDPDEALSW